MVNCALQLPLEMAGLMTLAENVNVGMLGRRVEGEALMRRQGGD